MGMPAARITDMHTCPMVTGIVPHVGGPISGPCCPTVLIGNLPAARVSDMAVCVGPPDVIVKGSAGVLIGGMPAARIGDMTAHGGVIILGCVTVLIGDGGGGGGGGGGAGSVAGMGAGQGGALKAASKSGAPFCEKCEAAKRAREEKEREEEEGAESDGGDESGEDDAGDDAQ